MDSNIPSTPTRPTERDRPHPHAIVRNNPLREQMGLAPEHSTDYDRLVLSLQSPLPNEQDLAIGVCTLLSNETKHALKLNKGPGVLELLIAHAGIFNHCDLRELMEQTYSKGRKLEFANFWLHVLPLSEIRELLCECALERYQNGYTICCPRCPCKLILSHPPDPQCSRSQTSDSDYRKYGLNKFTKVEDKIGQRVTQVASIIRNLSFDRVNAEVMSQNTSLLRFILITSNSCYGSLPQISFDVLGNIAKFMILEDPFVNPFYSMVLDLVTSGVFSPDRFRVLRSLETLREWSKQDANEYVLLKILDTKYFMRLCELMTINDIMMLIYTLECMLSLTSLGGEQICNEISRIQGSVETLISLVTVEAQTYGPKGCIHMRVVETVVGHPALLRNAKLTENPSEVQPQILPPRPLPLPTTVRPASPIALNTGAISVAHATNLPSNFHGTINLDERSNSPAPNQTLHNTFTIGLPTTLHSTLAAGSTVQVPTPSISPAPCPLSPGTTTIRITTPKVGGFTPITSLTNNTLTVTQNGIHATHLPAQVSQNHQVSAVPQVSRSSIMQQPQTISIVQPQPQVFTPTINIVAPQGNVNEDTWASTWMKAAFDHVAGSSIEQGEMYRMYCNARKNPAVVLGLKEFIACVKCTYGDKIGPVIKNFSGTPLSFLDGIRPRMTTVGTIATGVPIQTIRTNSIDTNSSTTCNPNAINNSSPQNSPLQGNPASPLAQEVVPSKDKKTTSPILKATLSRPPKTKNSNSVTQRQQKKLLQGDSKTNSKTGKGKKITGGKKKANNKNDEVKVNGIEGPVEPEGCSSANSFNSIESSESNNPPPLISFHGVLRNGLNSSDDSSKSENMVEKEDIKLHLQNHKLKGMMLVDLLDRKTPARETVNGVVGNKEIRISDKGLELVDKLEPECSSDSSNMSATSLSSTVLVNNNHATSEGTESTASKMNSVLNSVNLSNDSNTSDSQSSQQQMTFYGVSDSQTQLGLKRTHSMSEDSSSQPAHIRDEPPSKKYCESPSPLPNGNGYGYGYGLVSDTDSGISSIGSACNSPIIQSTTPSPVNHVTKGGDHFLDSPVRLVVSSSGVVQSCTTTTSTGSRLQVPIRLVSNPNPASPNQYSFTRQLLITSNQQFLLQSPSQPNLQGAQVLISKPSNSSNDQMAKAIIILQPQNQQANAPTGSNTIKLSTMCSTSSSPSTPVFVSSGSNSPLSTVNSTHKIIPSRILTSCTQSSTTTRSKPQLLSTKPSIQDELDRETPYMCEWLGCGLRFVNTQQVLLHALHVHAPETLTEAIRCEWGGNGCDALIRRRFSLMTHLQDRHCCKPALDLALYRRQNKIEPPQPIHQPLNHPGYAPNAAFHAIKRHALQFMDSKVRLDDNEGPVTKSIRLTSALILKNLCNYSSFGRRIIRRHESHLASIAMSNVESSRTIAQLLYDMDQFSS